MIAHLKSSKNGSIEWHKATEETPQQMEVNVPARPCIRVCVCMCMRVLNERTEERTHARTNSI